MNLYPHENSHNFIVSDCKEMPIFTKDWTALEELQMLKGIDKFGMGNWKAISEFIGTNKTTRNCEEHYFELYMGIHGNCLPPNTYVNDKPVSTESLAPPTNKDQPLVDFDEHLHDLLDLGRGDIVPRYERIDSYAPLNIDLFHARVTKGYGQGELVKRDIGKETGAKAKEKTEIRDRCIFDPLYIV